MFNCFVVTAMGYSYLPFIPPSVENLFFFIIGVTVLIFFLASLFVLMWKSGQDKGNKATLTVL